MQAIARRDGTVNLHVNCGESRTTVLLDVCRAAQISTGIWEAAGAAQYLGDDQPAPQPRPPGSGDLPESWRTHRNARSRDRAPRRRRQLPAVNQSAARDARRMIGLRLRRIREDQHKSLHVISGLAGMSTSTLHHVEHGRRELTLSEIVVLANALQIDPWKLIKLPIFTPINAHTDALEGREQQGAAAIFRQHSERVGQERSA
ncbi:MAG: helix-turn-helix domain-containing protein [Pseudonocardiaceae bacterium]